MRWRPERQCAAHDNSTILRDHAGNRHTGCPMSQGVFDEISQGYCEGINVNFAHQADAASDIECQPYGIAGPSTEFLDDGPHYRNKISLARRPMGRSLIGRTQAARMIRSCDGSSGLTEPALGPVDKA